MASTKSALVTGAATGIGRAATIALARAGYDVALNYSSSEKAARETAAAAGKLGAKTLVVRCDVSDEKGVRAMVQQVEQAFGRLDVLVNNAGTTASWKPKDLETLSLEEWDRVFAVNVRGLFQVTRACVPLLKKSGGCVVNTGSVRRWLELALPTEAAGAELAAATARAGDTWAGIGVRVSQREARTMGCPSACTMSASASNSRNPRSVADSATECPFAVKTSLGLCLASMRALAQSATICAIRSFRDSRAVLRPPTRTRG